MTRHAPLIVAACALLLTIVLWGLLYQPWHAEQASYDDETAQLEDQHSKLEAQVAALREVERNAADYRSRFERLSEYIPSTPAQPEALLELQRASDESGVEITETVFGDPEHVEGAPGTGDTGTTLARIPMQVTVEGGYFQVVDLLRRIEVDLGRAFMIDSVTMAEAEQQFPQLSATWAGQMFAVLPAGDVVESGQPVESSTETPTEAPTGATPSPDRPTESPTGGASLS